MTFSKVIGLMVFTCFSLMAHAQSETQSHRVEIQPILLNPPFFGGRAVIDLSKGQGPINFNRSGSLTIGGTEARHIETSCSAFVQGRLAGEVRQSENAREAAGVSFRSLINVVSALKRLESRLYLTSIERELLFRLKADVGQWSDSFKETALGVCLDEKWEKFPRIDHVQEEYLLESLEFIRVTLNTSHQ